MIPRFWLFFCISLVALTLLIFIAREWRPAAAAPEPSPSPIPAPTPEAVVRIGLFTIEPDDEEPRLAAEFLVGVPGPFDLRRETRFPGIGPATTQLSLGMGITSPSLLVPPTVEETVAIGVDSCKGSARFEADGTCQLDVHVVHERPGSSNGSTNSAQLHRDELQVLCHPGWGSSNGWWGSVFVLAHLETATAGSWDLEGWRSLVAANLARLRSAKGIERDRLRDATLAASWIPCPAARETLAKLKAEETESLGAARAMAGDPEAVRTAHFDQGWQPRTIYLRYPELRAAIEPEMHNPDRNEAPAGPLLAKRMPPGSRSVSPPHQDYVTVFGLVPWCIAGALLLAGLLALFGPARSLSAGAGAMALGCLFAVSKFQINWVNLPGLAALPFLLYGSVALHRRIGSTWIRAAALAAGAIVVAQILVLAHAPSWVARVGNLGYDVLPLLVLLAIEPLVESTTGLTPRKAIRGYALTVVLPTLAFIVVEAVDAVAGRGHDSYTVATPLAIGFVGLNIASIYYSFGGFWSLRRRLNMLSSTTIDESAAPAHSQ